uniref:Adenylate kinase-like protein n=1 Tax=Caulobacter sp. (strain K31) TaxID=366602 RepID=B0SXW9_CAUSK
MSREAASTLILFGISGVGKTTASRRILTRFPGILHFQASTLLKAVLSQSGEALRTASPAQIASNQRELAEALRRERAGDPCAPALLDAHSVIDNDATLVELPFEIFAPIRPVAIAFLRADPDIIRCRRQNDGRARPARTNDQLAAHQHQALEAARRHASALQIPFAVVDSDAPEALLDFVKLHLNLEES